MNASGRHFLSRRASAAHARMLAHNAPGPGHGEARMMNESSNTSGVSLQRGYAQTGAKGMTLAESKASNLARRGMSEDAQRTISHQREVIQTLRKENASLATELEREVQASELAPTAQQAEELARLQEECDRFGRRIEMEHQKVEELNGLLGALESRASKARHRMGGVQAIQERASSIMQQQRILENRLEKENVNFNEAVAQNKMLRAEIDSLRKERLRFQGIYKKTERELELARQQMQDVMQSATAAREARDEAHNMMASMQAEQDRQAKAYDRALGQMQTIVERDRNLMEIERQRQLAVAELAADTTRPAQPTLGKTLSMRNNWTGSDGPKSPMAGANAVSKTQSYQDALSAILSATGTEEVEEFLEEFSRMEERNFNMFNLQRELDAEVEALEERLGGIRDEAQRLRQQSKRNEDERRQVIASAEEQRNRAQEALTTNRQRLEESTAELKRIRVVVGDIVKKLGARPAVSERELGASGGEVTESNVMLYMAAAEQRASDMVTMYEVLRDNGLLGQPEDSLLKQLTEALADGEGAMAFVKRPQDTLGHVAADVVPPSSLNQAEISLWGTSDNENDDLDDGRPLLAEEIKSRMQATKVREPSFRSPSESMSNSIKGAKRASPGRPARPRGNGLSHRHSASLSGLREGAGAVGR